MRSLFASALVLLAACGPADRSDSSAAHDAPSATQARGPDPLVLRVARSGGPARVYAYARLDSLIWSAPGTPRIDEVLGFDPEQGVISFVDTRDVPGRIDLRMGDVAQAGSKFKLTAARTADGSSVYGISDGTTVRFTPTGGEWEFDPDRDVGLLFPQQDGALVAMSRRRDGDVTLWRLYPPQTRVLDSVLVRDLTEGPRVQAGDLLYLGTTTGIAIVNARTLDVAAPIALDAPALDAVGTPSGDRLFIAVEGEPALAVYDRYRGRLGNPVELPGEARALRMDPLGRYLLARPLEGDSAWVIAVGTRKHVGTVRTAWRQDLPFIGPDGSVATVRGEDVVFLDATTLRPKATVPDGAADHWFPFSWNGFRPRDADLDRPVEFSVNRPDTVVDTTAAPPVVDSARADTAAAPPPPPQPTQWIVSFAALLVEEGARSLAREITVEGQNARVQTTLRDGVPVYRVVLGPYAQREVAERIGRSSGKPYWVYAASQ